MENIGELRMNPFVSRDNCFLLDVNLACGELGRYSELGGDTVVDPTNFGIGRDPPALQRIARRTRLNIVMGSGFYLEAVPSRLVHPHGRRRGRGLHRRRRRRRRETAGRHGRHHRRDRGRHASSRRPSRNRCAPRRAPRASTGVPLSIHLPGWERLAHKVLDIVEEEGADLNHTVLCHMNPSGRDLDYQTALAARGAFLEYDMIGMDYYYAD